MSIVGYSNFVLKKMPKANDLLAENLRLEYDKKFSAKFNELDIDSLNRIMNVKSGSDYGNYWRSLNDEKKGNLVYRGEEGQSKNHECIMDEETFRCKVCGRSLKWTTYGISPDSDPFGQKLKNSQISYYPYNALVKYIEKSINVNSTSQLRGISALSNELNNTYDSNFLSLNNFTDIKDTKTLRDYSYFTLGLPFGEGFSFHLKNQKDQEGKPPESIQNLKMIGQQPRELEFFADFECANMQRVFWDGRKKKVRILLRSDTNTDGYAKWFFFGCRLKCHEDVLVTFEILNCRKSDELISNGMKIAIAKIPEQSSQSSSSVQLWQFNEASEVVYKESPHPRKVVKRLESFQEVVTEYQGGEVIEGPDLEQQCEELLAKENEGKDVSAEKKELYESRLVNSIFVKKKFSTLSFTYRFNSNSYNQSILFALTRPYPFSRLIEFLETLENSIKRSSPLFNYNFNQETRTYTLDNPSIYYQKVIIGATQLGLPITELTITSPDSQKSSLVNTKKPYIFVLARLHPIESPSSFVCQGMIQYLLSNEQEAQTLRSLFIFKIIPMANPDGVTVGNSRTSLEGLDLNRCWKNPNQDKTPEIYCIKESIKKIVEQKKQIFMFLDLRGHQQKLDTFLVSTSKSQNSTFEWAKNNLYPRLCAEHCKYFNLSSCMSVPITHGKKLEAREVMWSEFNIEHCYSVETSFYGWKESEEIIKPFEICDFEEIGQVLCKSLLQLTGCQTLMEEQMIKRDLSDMTEELLLNGDGTEDKELGEVEKKNKAEKENKESKKKKSGADGLNKFQKQVLKSQSQLKVIFKLQKGLNWNQFYSKDDLQKIKEQTEYMSDEEYDREKKALSDSDPEDDYKLDVLKGQLENEGYSEDQEKLFKQRQEELERRIKKRPVGRGESFDKEEEERNRQSKLRDGFKKGKSGTFLNKFGKNIRDDQNGENDFESSIEGNLKKRKTLLINHDGNEDEDGVNSAALDLNKKNIKELNLLNQLNGKLTTPLPFGWQKMIGFQDKIKLKNPFLPSQSEIFEAYSLKSPKSIHRQRLYKQQTQDLINQSASPSHSPENDALFSASMTSRKVLRRSDYQRKESFKQQSLNLDHENTRTYKQRPLTSHQSRELLKEINTRPIPSQVVNQRPNTAGVSRISLRKVRPSTSQSHQSERILTYEDNVMEQSKEEEKQISYKHPQPDNQLQEGPYLSNSIFGGFFALNSGASKNKSFSIPSPRLSKIIIPSSPSKTIVSYRPLSAAKKNIKMSNKINQFAESVQSPPNPQLITEKSKQMRISKINVTKLYKSFLEQKSNQQDQWNNISMNNSLTKQFQKGKSIQSIIQK